MARPSVIDLLAIALHPAAAVFGVQEAVESLAAGTGPDPAVFLDGIADELPMALVCARALTGMRG